MLCKINNIACKAISLRSKAQLPVTVYLYYLVYKNASQEQEMASFDFYVLLSRHKNKLANANLNALKMDNIHPIFISICFSQHPLLKIKKASTSTPGYGCARNLRRSFTMNEFPYFLLPPFLFLSDYNITNLLLFVNHQNQQNKPA